MEKFNRLAANRLWDVAMLALAIVCLARLAVALPERAHRIDFAHYYTSSRLLVQTGQPYGVELAPHYRQYEFEVPEDIAQATNPPALLWLFAPFAMLTPGSAFIAWTLLQTLALGVIFWQTKRLLRGRLSDRAWRFVCLGTLASHAIYWHYCMSQTQLLLAALVLTGFTWQQEGKHFRACLAVAAAGLVKLFPFILLPWFVWRGRWKSALAAAAFITGIILLTGIGQWRDFFRHGYPLVAGWALNHNYNCSLPSLVINLAGSSSSFWWNTGILLGLLLIAAAYLTCHRERRDAEVEFSLVTVAMLAGSLVAWGHYLVFLIFPVAVWITRLGRDPSLGKIATFAMALAFLNIGPQQNAFLLAHPYLNILANWMPLYGLLIMGAALARELKSPGTSETS